ncbi:MAG: DCC1-like thiol-disulfide oxidoreductase family protein [Woeseiaceae bacterium]|nr:DCC1-like thiol-disulfide oxidoreductase family protein [Woeseiaceae bacterium]
MNDAPPDIEVVYDKECPVCDFYCTRVDVDSNVGTVKLVDAREPGATLDDVTALGLDIDEGMVVKIDDQLYYGPEAIHELAKLSSSKGLVNGLGKLSFRSRTAARILYPFLKGVRNLLLKALGKTRINNLGLPDRDRF